MRLSKRPAAPNSRSAGRLFAAALVGLAISIAARPTDAAEIVVPRDQATVQAAIQAATDGDVVSVEPGTYVETIDFLGKAITVRSLQGPEVTVLDGGGNGSVVTLSSMERNDSVLEGFTIRGGTGTVVGASLAYGGGIYCGGSAPILRRNVVRENTANNGGGIYFCGTGIGAVAIIEDSTILDNSAGTAGGFGGHGGGIGCAEIASVDIVRTTLDTNDGKFGGGLSVLGGSVVNVDGGSFVANGASSKGAGIYVIDGSTLQLLRCEIRENLLVATDLGDGGGVYSEDATLRLEDTRIADNAFVRSTITSRGAGLFLAGGMTEVFGGSVEGNTATGSGGGIAIVETGNPSNCRIDGMRIVGNEAGQNGGGIGAINSSSGILVVTNSIIADNSAAQRGGGIYLAGGPPRKELDLRFDHNTLAGNTAPQGSAIRWETRRQGRFSNGIVYHHDQASPPITDTFGSLAFVFCDIEGGATGEGNIDVDPRFVDAAGDRHLRLDSPCIEIGSEFYLEEGNRDVDGDERIVDGDGDGLADIDIGADELRREIAVRYGYVADVNGNLVNVLRINGTGGDAERRVRVQTRQSITIDLAAAPIGPAQARYVLYAWAEEPDTTTLTLQPFGLGYTGFPTFLTHPPGSGNLPIAVVKTFAGRNGRLGRPKPPNIQPVPAPMSLDLPTGLGRATKVTLQALLEDSGSSAQVPLSVTNAVVLEVVDG